jgi:hypothetical protein
MGQFYDQIPEELKQHVKEITRTSGLPDTEESLEKISEAWLEKRKVFEEKTRNLNLEDAPSLGMEEERGALALTYSGSLVTIGPLVEGSRKVAYVSIGLRSDVPETAEKEGSVLKKDVTVDDSIEFKIGPVKNTSSILKIAVPTANLSVEEQEEKITEATQVIQEEFVEVNKTIIEQ